MKMQRFWVGRALLLAVAVLYAGGYVRAQEAKDTLTLTLDRALEIALSDNPTIKVAEEEIALKKVTHKGPGRTCFRRQALTVRGIIPSVRHR